METGQNQQWKLFITFRWAKTFGLWIKDIGLTRETLDKPWTKIWTSVVYSLLKENYQTKLSKTLTQVVTPSHSDRFIGSNYL